MSMTFSRNALDVGEALLRAQLYDDWGLLARVAMTSISDAWHATAVRKCAPHAGRAESHAHAHARAALLHAELHLSDAAWFVLMLEGMAVARTPEPRPYEL